MQKLNLLVFFSLLFSNFISSNSEPNIISENFTSPENQTEIGTIEANDSDGDELLFYLLDNSQILIGENTGNLTFRENPDYEQQNAFNITVLVTDGIDTVSKEISIEVTDINEKPFLTKTEYDFIYDETSRIRIKAVDPENAKLTFSLGGKDASLFTISNNGQLKCINSPTSTQASS